MRINVAKAALLVGGLLASSAAHADQEADRLREALRSSIAQSRSLEDQRAALQGKVAEAERERTELKAQSDAAKEDVRQLKKENREAIDEFNQRLAERDETLDKWKTAYQEAATVARAKDAARAKFEGEAAAFKASTKSCKAKNAELVKVGREILARYRSLTLGGALVAGEPLTGFGRIDAQNFLQDSDDKILDQKVAP